MARSPKGVTVVDHPLVQHKLTLMRKKDTSTKSFRQLLKEIGALLCYEVTRDLPLELIEIETPMQTMQAPQLVGKKLVFAAILRSGMGMLEGMLELAPAARVAHIGLYRDPATLNCVEYYFKAPADIAQRTVVVIDPMLAPAIAGKKLVFAAILRSGMGMLDGMLDLVPAARVGHIGLYRDPATLNCVEYYFKFPADLGERQVIVIDPMLATGNTAIAAVDRLKEAGAKNVRMACLLCSPEGVSKFLGHHPEVKVWTASIDERLNDHGYILPGLGDAGDRMYGTR